MPSEALEGKPMIRACGWCHRINVDDEWIVAPRPTDQPVTDGICPPCEELYNARLDALDNAHTCAPAPIG